MKSINKLCLVLVAVLFIFSSCSNSKLPDDSLKQVPANVTSVTAFNMNALMAKADYEHIKTLDFFKDGLEDLKNEQAVLGRILENPMASGVDLTKNAYVVMDLDENAPQEKQFGAMVFSIKDYVKFETLLLSISDNEEAIVRPDFRFYGKNEQMMVAWNDDFGMIAAGHRSLDLEAYVHSYFDKNKETSIADNKDLAKCLEQEYDMAVWMNTDVLAENDQYKTAAAFLGISSEAMKGNYVHSFMNFENGAIKGHSQHFLKKELTNDLDLFFKNGVKKDLAKYIPAKDLGLAFGAALDAKGIYQIISEKTGGVTAVNAGLKKFGFTSKDLANAFGGDIVVAVYGNGQKNEVPSGLLTSTIGDKKLFQQFIELAVQYEVLTAGEDGVYFIKDGPKELKNAFLLVKEDVFFVTNNEPMLETLKTGGYKSADRIPSDVFSAMANNAFGGSMNFDILKKYSDEFEQVPFVSAKMDAGLKSSHMQVDLKDKEMNSLKSIFNFINDLYLKNETRKQAKDEAVLEMEI